MKRGRKKCGNKDKVFGCDLTEHLATTNQEIPQVLRSCSEFIEEHGVVDGIYRLSGVSSNTQKLRSEFDTEATPELYKDVYLQDIHCVSSLCKAYFRELPNPLLTYQLYDHFAEAVAVQLEDERLVKIKEVLKELPSPHYRTLEFLMRHLVRMSTFSSQTNMHARNLAIVWAPNLLRSKDIEASGFNGTAAFMEVRVQSIVVEFILTHVPQLFPESDSESGWTRERRKSLPSPTSQPGQPDFFKAIPFHCPGNMSPGDGPLQMKPYHAIIDGTDKKKGSLKGRKWKSIFNLGGRLQDPRKKNKYAPKEKDQNSLRPAKSMDSLSSGLYTHEDSQHPGTHLSPVAVMPGNADGAAPGKGNVSSGYAVTYRRTGGASVSVVSGGTGAQGTYKNLDTGTAPVGDRSPSVPHVSPSKAERRAGMHISGPFSVTVPLHITSGLALGVLHGGRVEEEQLAEGIQLKTIMQEKDEEEAEEAADKITENLEEIKNNNTDVEETEDAKEEDGNEKEVEDLPDEKRESREEDREEEFVSEDECKDEKQEISFRPSFGDGDYMVMRPIEPPPPSEARDLSPLSLDVAYPEQDLPLDFQDTFGFLDLMDTSVSNQVNEFSVEPPAFEDEEDDDDKQSPSQVYPATLSHLCKEKPRHSPRLQTGKSHSLPYKSCPFLPIPGFSSDEDDYSGPDEDGSESDKSEYEDMFIKSLPSSSHFHALKWTCTPTIMLSGTDETDFLNQVPTPELPQNISEDLTSVESSELFENQLEIDSHVQSLDEEDLSSLSLDAECLNVEKNTDGKDGEDRAADELWDEEEMIQEEREGLEIVDSKEDALLFSQEESHSIETEPQENSFCPDITFAFLELANVDISCHSDQPFIEEDETISDHQQESPEGSFDMAENEITVVNSTDSVLVDVHDDVELNVIAEGIVMEVSDKSDSGGVFCSHEKEDESEEGIEMIKIDNIDEKQHVEAHTEKYQEHNEQLYQDDDGKQDMAIDDKVERTDSVSDDGVTEINDSTVYEEDEDDFHSDEKVTEDKPADTEEPMKFDRIEEIENDIGVDIGLGVGRSLITSKPKIYQVKAVPVVPPKPQHSKITAFKQQFQQNDTKQKIKKDNYGMDRIANLKMSHQVNTRQNHDAQTVEMTNTEQPQQDMADQPKKQQIETPAVHGTGKEQKNEKEDPKQRRLTWDGGSLRKDVLKETDKEIKKASAVSMCFDEAVARATGKLCREKELLEKDRLLDLQVERFEPNEGLKQRQKDEGERN